MPIVTARSAVEACLAQIDRREARVRAWVTVDAAGARRTAQRLDEESRSGRRRGPLHGIPVALKDIFDAAGMTTTSGAGAFAHRQPDRDAAAVARLRDAGAVILGKTVTTQFAFADPAVTRNPWNLSHTPGGSSSGSATAVAAGMADVALGSQTIGSTIRPAAYCGIVGFKGTYGRISTDGVTPLAWSLDHVGIFARSVADAALAFSVLAGERPIQSGLTRAAGGGQRKRAAETGRRGTVGSGRRAAAAGPRRDGRAGAPRIGVLSEWTETTASPEVRAHVQDVAALFRRAGAAVADVTLPPSAVHIDEQGRLILRAEAAAYHGEWFVEHAGEYAPKIRALVESGLGVSAVDYVRAHHLRGRFRSDVAALLERHDVLLLPSAPSPAPLLAENTTGDPIFCAPWTFAGFPAIALPSGRARSGLPLSIQLVGALGADRRLLEQAQWCEAVLAFAEQPPL